MQAQDYAVGLVALVVVCVLLVVTSGMRRRARARMSPDERITELERGLASLEERVRRLERR